MDQNGLNNKTLGNNQSSKEDLMKNLKLSDNSGAEDWNIDNSHSNHKAKTMDIEVRQSHNGMK
jgi:hypothetical protein